MGALFNIIVYSIENLILGVLLTVVGVAFMFFIIRSWYSNRAFTFVSYAVGVVLFFFLSFQAILLGGAVTICSYADNVEMAVNGWVQGMPESMMLDADDSQQILESIQNEWPLVGYFIGEADFTGHTPLDIASAMAEELRSYMNRFYLASCGMERTVRAGGGFCCHQDDGKDRPVSADCCNAGRQDRERP